MCSKSAGSFAQGTVENAIRINPESTIVPVLYASMRCLRTASASTPLGFTHMKYPELNGMTSNDSAYSGWRASTRRMAA